MHAEFHEIDIQDAIDSGPLTPDKKLTWSMYGLVVLGVVVFFVALISSYPDKLLWGAYYTNLLFWMGLAVGGVMTTVIFQIVRAKWSAPIRRIAESNVAFLPWAFLFLLASYFGRVHLFPWGDGSPMPGRESWMNPDFVYIRFTILFGIFFLLLARYVCLSLRGDIGLVREVAADKECWKGWVYARLSKDWKGVEEEVPRLQRKMSWNAPVLLALYALLYTFFSTEMIVGMDTIWFSNMFGGFQFLGNIYIAWASIAIIAIYLAKKYPAYGKILHGRQLWDLGLLTFGFCMLWGYTFFSQFLPQWYSNMPEETQWLILRVRDEPWAKLSWLTFSFCFVIPFIVLLSEDVKRTPKALVAIAMIVLAGVWLEKYVVVMPQLAPEHIPFCFVEIGLFLGFFGVYVLSLQSFLKRYPFVPVSHPMTKGSTEW